MQSAIRIRNLSTIRQKLREHWPQSEIFLAQTKCLVYENGKTGKLQILQKMHPGGTGGHIDAISMVISCLQAPKLKNPGRNVEFPSKFYASSLVVPVFWVLCLAIG